MKKLLKDTKGSTFIEAAVVLPILFICAMGLIHTSIAMYTEAEDHVTARREMKWKVEDEAEFIRNGELVRTQI